MFINFLEISQEVPKRNLDPGLIIYPIGILEQDSKNIIFERRCGLDRMIATIKLII